MSQDNDLNLDPITKEPGSHPVGTGLGAAVGGVAAGAAVGAVAGPVGAVIGGIAGAWAGGVGGSAAAEGINPTAEEAYWRENYSREPYYEGGRTFDDYGPAYRLGVYNRSISDGDFDASSAEMERQWALQTERSTLDWPQAQLASRSAWDRIDARGRSNRDYTDTTALTGNVSGGPNGVIAGDDDVVSILNDLLESCRDGEYGFRESAEHTKAADVKTLLLRHADECRNAGLELMTLIRQLGGQPDEGGSIAGALHRGWVSVRGTLSGYSDHAMLDECERGEDAALARYRKSLQQNLPAAIRSVVERQQQGAQKNHDEIKALRDTLRAGR